MSAKEQVKKEIIEAYVFLRTNNMTIPSETLEFMKDSSLKALDQAINYTHCCKSDSEQLQAVEDLKDFARNNCREWNIEEMEEIIDRL